jgi:hypothetical protein
MHDDENITLKALRLFWSHSVPFYTQLDVRTGVKEGY